MKSAHTLKVHRRERLGSRYAQRERVAGRLPGVLYGHGRTPVAISLETREALRYFHAGEKVFTVDLPGEDKGQTVILKDLQFDYLGTNVVHVDLARVDLNEQIEANVPVRLVGEAVGMKKAGAILTHPSVAITVRCTVLTLPDHVDVNISELDLSQSIHANQIVLPAGVTLASDPDAVVAAISLAKEEVVATEAVAVEGEAAQPEVITAKKEAPEEGAAAGKAEGGKPEAKKDASKDAKKEKK